MMKRLWLATLCLVAGFFLPLCTAWAVTPEELKEMLDQGAKVTIIDVRHTTLYAAGHIPGAINIPSSIIAMKRFPPIGDVVVCGDGIRLDLTQKAADELNTRTGIRAEILEGGIGAWEALRHPTTHQQGFAKRQLTYLTYEEFEKAVAHNPQIVVVDLRGRSLSDKTETSQGTNEASTNLSAKFPGLAIIKPNRRRDSGRISWDISSNLLKKGRGAYHRFHYVMIDDGNGEAEKMAYRLFAAGIKRVAVLTGGEQTLSREGRPGFKTIKEGQKTK